MAENYVPRLRTHYKDVVRAGLTDQFNYQNHLQVPKLDKVVLNMGVGEAVNDTKKVKSALADMEAIAGQSLLLHMRRSLLRALKYAKKCLWALK